MSRGRGKEGFKLTPGKRAILVVLALAPIGVLIYSMVFMAQNEAAFDEATCPYQVLETRAVAEGVEVREDGRRCQADVEEHRWVLLRAGEEPEGLGLRRLDAELYRDYSWTATIRDDGRVRLEIVNGELDPRVFNEPYDDAGVR